MRPSPPPRPAPPPSLRGALRVAPIYFTFYIKLREQVAVEALFFKGVLFFPETNFGMTIVNRDDVFSGMA